ncbi:MAG: 5'-methylthioadenosine nucleosidase [Gammaproteobacteria bacterium]
MRMFFGIRSLAVAVLLLAAAGVVLPVVAEDVAAKGGGRYIIVAAVPQETKGLSAFAPVVHTGVGKVSAAIALFEAVNKYRPSLVINYGSAGAVGGLVGLHRVDTFVERDMDARALGFARGVAPFSAEGLPPAEGIVLGSGDSFVTDIGELEGLDIRIDLVDMEGFALHKVCRRLGIDFAAYKYVSDDADDEAAGDWEVNAAKGAALFAEVLRKEYGKSSLLNQ